MSEWNDDDLEEEEEQPNWQTTIQREARALLGVKKGDEIEWILKNGEVIVRKVEENE